MCSRMPGRARSAGLAQGAAAADRKATSDAQAGKRPKTLQGKMIGARAAGVHAALADVSETFSVRIFYPAAWSLWDLTHDSHFHRAESEPSCC